MIELPPGIDREAQLLDLDRADCEESLHAFLQHAWKYMDPAPFTDGWHLQAIAEHLEAIVDGSIRRLIINLPPRHCKSLLLSVAFPAWVWAQPIRGPVCGPNVPFLFASYADKLSLRDSVKCRRLIESPWYQKRWGHRFSLTSDQNTKSRFANDQGGERLITSIGAGVTGEGGNCFVAGTPIWTISGNVPIERLRVGDKVIARMLNGIDTEAEIIAVAKRQVAKCVRVTATIGDSEYASVVCTPDHLFYTGHDGWKSANELDQGEFITHESGNVPVTVLLEPWPDSRRNFTVYDIQVKGWNNFYANGLLVHNCIIIDDPNAANDVASEATMATTIEWWTTTMPTRANDPETAAWIIIQQRLAEDDLTGHILEHEADGWTHLCLPGRYEPERSFHTVIGWKDPRTEPGELLWPERFSDAALKRLEVTMGPYIFAGQIQQRPEPKGGGIIKREWWKLWDRDSYPPMDFVLGVVDTAYTEDEMNDPSGMIVWGVFSGDVKAETTRIVGSQDMRSELISRDATYAEFAPHVMCMWAWDARLELHELVEKVAQTCIKMKVDLLVIENKASGISVAQEIRRLYSRERFGVKLFDPKSQDKTARLYSVQHLFAEGIVYAPDRPWLERVISQVAAHPRGKHDEYVDLTSMGLRELRDMGLLIRQPEREAENESQKVYPRGQAEPLYPV